MIKNLILNICLQKILIEKSHTLKWFWLMLKGDIPIKQI